MSKIHAKYCEPGCNFCFMILGIFQEHGGVGVKKVEGGIFSGNEEGYGMTLHAKMANLAVLVFVL